MTYKNINSKHDKLISFIIKDNRFYIDSNGTIIRNGKEIGYTKLTELKLRNKQYKYIKYKNKEINVRRILYRKFGGELTKGLVVHHLDWNGLNNNISNLSLISQKENSKIKKIA